MNLLRHGGLVWFAWLQYPSPGQPPSSFQHAAALVQQGKPQEAIPVLERLSAESPSDLRTLNLLGIALSQTGRRADANLHFTKAIQLDPAFVPALKNLAVNEIALGDRPNGRRHFEQVIKLAPTDPVANLALGDLCYQDKRYSEAAAFYKASGSLVFQDPATILRAAGAAAEAKNPDEAAGYLDRLSAAEGVETQFAAGLLLSRLERFEPAARRFVLAEAGYRDRYAAGYNAALAFHRAGRLDEALAAATRLQASGQDKAELLNLVAQIHEQAGQTQQAYDALRKATEIDPGDESNYLDLVALCLQHENYDLGQEIAAIGLERIPKSHRLYLQRGVVSSMQGRLDAAELDFTKAVNLSPAEAGLAVASRGMVLMQLDRAAEAVELLRERFRSHPDDYLAGWFLAEALVKQGAPEGSTQEREAFDAVSASVRLKSDVPQPRVLFGKLLVKRNRLAEAAEQLETAMRLDPKDTSAAYQLAVVYRRQGNRARADELFAKVGQAKSGEADRQSTQVLIRILREGEEGRHKR